MPTTFPLPQSIPESNIAVFGGAFDPTTNAHVGVALAVRKVIPMPIWMMPCYGHLHGKELSAPMHRFRMVDLATAGEHYITACDFEIRRHHSGSMFDTLTALSKEYPGKLFHLVIGLDNANVIHRWHRGEELVGTYPCIVVGRHGHSPLTEWYLHPPHMYVEFDMNVCATDVRAAIAEGRHAIAKNLVGDRVWNYIVGKKLYGYKDHHEQEAE